MFELLGNIFIVIFFICLTIVIISYTFYAFKKFVIEEIFN